MCDNVQLYECKAKTHTHRKCITMETMHAVSLLQFGFYCTRNKTKMKTNSDAWFGSLVRFTLPFCSLPYAIWLRCDAMINEIASHHFGCRIHVNISLWSNLCTVSLKCRRIISLPFSLLFKIFATDLLLPIFVLLLLSMMSIFSSSLFFH